MRASRVNPGGKQIFGSIFASRVLRTWSRTLLAHLPLVKNETHSPRRYMTFALCQRTNYRILREKKKNQQSSKPRTTEVTILLSEKGCSRNSENFASTWMQSLISRYACLNKVMPAIVLVNELTRVSPTIRVISLRKECFAQARHHNLTSETNLSCHGC